MTPNTVTIATASLRSSDPDCTCWKDIARVLGVSVPTAKRWEDRGMPVFARGPRGVVAWSAEIKAWAMRVRERRAA
jgi:phage terminase Nu1 subunit (DNA packaging protein)